MGTSIKIPTLEEIEEGLDLLKNVNWSNLNFNNVDDYVNQIENYLSNTFGLFFRNRNISNTEILNKAIHNYRSVFRLRVYDKNINEEVISEFSHPPVSASKRLGRANFPYHPVFYGAPNVGTAMLETLETLESKFDPQKDNYFYLSEWVFKEFTPLHITWFTFGNYISESDLSLFSRHYIENILSLLNATSEEERKKLEKLMKAFGELFQLPNNHYLAAYMAHTHLYHKDSTPTELFIYPSIQTEKVSLNYAIHPNTVIHKMSLKKVYQIKVINYWKGGFGKADYEIAFLKYGTNNYNGNLIWNIPGETDCLDFEILFPPKSQYSIF
jgi:hypothetical protein